MSLSPAGTAEGPGWAVRLCWEGLETVMMAHNLLELRLQPNLMLSPGLCGPCTHRAQIRPDRYTAFK